MKALKWIAWVSTGIGSVIILLGAIALITKSSIFGIHQSVNFFHTASSFLLLAIALFLADKNSTTN